MWDDPEAAQALMKERAMVQQPLSEIQEIEAALSDAITLIELGEEGQDEPTVQEGEKGLDALVKKAKTYSLSRFFSGEADHCDAFLEIHSGAGGTEAQDWTEMLLRMYLRWAEAHGYKSALLQESPGEEAGLKSVTIQLSGMRAYGWLKGESGVHRLVRISPFDSNAKRHTSFASVWVYPVIDKSIEIEILDKDLKIDTYRSSGAGGQHVNTTDSAIRITHLPTGIVVQCQNDRSQHRNRAQAMEMLKARLYEAELRRREESAASDHAEKSDIGFGNQIRSYVLQPYQLIKDLRTGVETSNTQRVLDGEIDLFLEACLGRA